MNQQNTSVKYTSNKVTRPYHQSQDAVEAQNQVLHGLHSLTHSMSQYRVQINIHLHNMPNERKQNNIPKGFFKIYFSEHGNITP